MAIRQNIADTVRKKMAEQNRKLEEFSEELGIARSSLQEYLKGTVNPRADTIELLAEKLKITPAELVSGSENPPGWEEAQRTLRLAELFADLPEEKRRQAAQAFITLVEIFAQKQEGSLK